MKKLVKPYGKFLPPVKLFLDDIEKVVGILGEVSNSIELITEEYSLDNVDKLRELHSEYLTKLEIRCRDPYISVHLKPDSVWLYIADDTPASLGVFEKVKSVLHSRRRKLSWLLTGGTAYVALGIVFGVLLSLLLPPRMTIPFAVGGITSLIIVVLWAWQIYVISLRKYSLVILQRYAEQKSFWRRNKDRIIVGVVSAVGGGLIMLLITQLLSVITSSR